METTRTIQADIASGAALLRYIKNDEATYAHILLPYDRGVVATWSVGVDSKDGGTYGEWSLSFYKFDSHDGSRAVRLDIFGDGVLAAMSVPGFFEAVAASDGTEADMERSLIALGFKDATPRN